MKKLNKVCRYFHDTDLYDCPRCGLKLRDFYKELEEKVNAVPKELKQLFLNHLKDGKNIGDAIKEIDPESKYENIVWFNIVKNQIKNYRYTSFEYNLK